MKQFCGFLGLNYKELTSGNSDPLDVLSPVLNQDNVAAIAKLASNVNDKVRIINSDNTSQHIKISRNGCANYY